MTKGELSILGFAMRKHYPQGAKLNSIWYEDGNYHFKYTFLDKSRIRTMSKEQCQLYYNNL